MQPASEGRDETRYRAFISYSHADRAFAARLHRRLEATRIRDDAGIAQRLAPVFLDRAELPAATDLSAEVKSALVASAALVVVASPNAAASRWVDREIALFRSLHPDRPVLVALIDGEPDQAFPPGLLAHEDRTFEPLAADFRRNGDGNRLALLKIVAGLSGHPLDRLVQRDAQTRLRRVMAVTAATVVLSLVLAGLLIAALRAQSEAERQRTSAEGMVEFMLTDLRQDLKGAASLPVMNAVNARAMAHYAQQDLADLPADSLTRRARLLHTMGEDDAQRGRFDQAQRKWAEAARTTAAVRSQRPGDADAVFAHAQSEFWTGFAAWQQKNFAATGRHWRAYRAEADRLAELEPGTLRSLAERGYANGNLCELTNAQTRDPLKALPLCAAATEYMRRAVAHKGAGDVNRMDLANRLGWQADVLHQVGRLREAEQLRRDEAGIVESMLAARPADRQLRERRLWPEIGLAKLDYAAGRYRQGFTRARATLAAYAALEGERPGDVGLIAQKLRVAVGAAEAAQAARKPEAAEFVTMAEDLYAILAARLPARDLVRYAEMMEPIRKGATR